MGEKTYQTMKGAGFMDLIIGIVILAAGLASGVLLIITGAKLLSRKSKVLF